MLRSIVAAFVLTLSIGGWLSGCGGSDEPRVDLTPVADSIPTYPGARLHSEAVPPAGMHAGKRSDYTYDRLFSVYGADNIPQETMLDFFRGRLPEQGWVIEDPMGTPSKKQFESYCQGQITKCASFTKGNIRAIISSPIRLSFNPTSTNLNNYHVHLETF